MKKHMIAIMLSLAMASSSVGAVPALAVETTVEEAVAEQEEISDEQEEVSVVMEDSDSGLADEDVLNEEKAQTEEDPVQEESVEETDSDDEQEETADTVDTTELAEEDAEDAAESEDGDDASAEVTATVEPLVIEEEAVTSEENEAGFAGDVVDSGKCGDNAKWTLTGTGDNLTLTISGNGATYNYFQYEKDGPVAPWESIETINKRVTAAIVEEGITSIGDNFFCGLLKMTSISLPHTLTSIGTGAFKYCGINTVTIPDGVTRINDNTFNNCKLNSITIPTSVKSIGRSAFFYCDRLKSITIPDGVTRIESGTFCWCESLTSITIPKSVKSIGVAAFEDCRSLESIIIPDGVTSISDRTFRFCFKLTNITIPDTVTTIGDEAFCDCRSLTSITIPNSVTSIKEGAFYACNLESITIPNSVTSIGSRSIGHNEDNNTTIIFLGTKDQWDKAVGQNEIHYKTIIFKPSPAIVDTDFELSQLSYSYTGKEIEPSVTGIHGGKQLVKNTDFTVSYANNTNAGVATVIIKGIGNYTGTVTKTFRILPGKTTRGDLFNLADNIKITWEAVPGAKYYKVYRNGVNEPVVVTTGLVGWDKCTTPKLEPGKMYTYKIVASTTGKGDSSGDSSLSYTKSIYRLQTTAFKYIKNTAPGKVTVSYKKSDYGDSYVLLYADNEEMKNAKSKVIYGADTTSVVLGGFKKGKTYWFQIRVRKSVAGYKLPFYTTFGAKKTVTIKQ